MIRRERQRLLQLRDRPVPLSLSDVHARQIVVRLRIVWPYVNRLPVRLDRLLDIPLIVVGGSQIVVRLRVGAIQFRRLLVRVYGLIEFLQTMICESQIVVRLLVGRILTDRSPVPAGRLLVPLQPGELVPRAVVRRGVHLPSVDHVHLPGLVPSLRIRAPRADEKVVDPIPIQIRGVHQEPRLISGIIAHDPKVRRRLLQIQKLRQIIAPVDHVHLPRPLTPPSLSGGSRNRAQNQISHPVAGHIAHRGTVAQLIVRRLAIYRKIARCVGQAQKRGKIVPAVEHVHFARVRPSLRIRALRVREDVADPIPVDVPRIHGEPGEIVGLHTHDHDVRVRDVKVDQMKRRKVPSPVEPEDLPRPAGRSPQPVHKPADDVIYAIPIDIRGPKPVPEMIQRQVAPHQHVRHGPVEIDHLRQIRSPVEHVGLPGLHPKLRVSQTRPEDQILGPIPVEIAGPHHCPERTADRFLAGVRHRVLAEDLNIRRRLRQIDHCRQALSLPVDHVHLARGRSPGFGLRVRRTEEQITDPVPVQVRGPARLSESISEPPVRGLEPTLRAVDHHIPRRLRQIDHLRVRLPSVEDMHRPCAVPSLDRSAAHGPQDQIRDPIPVDISSVHVKSEAISLPGPEYPDILPFRVQIDHLLAERRVGEHQQYDQNSHPSCHPQNSLVFR